MTFCWVPGHVGVAGNEQADRAAAAAVDNEFVSPRLFLHRVIMPISLLPYGADGCLTAQMAFVLANCWSKQAPFYHVLHRGTSCRANRYSEVILA